jgi:ethanolamine utilization microcompartment shell protein EutL
MTQAHPQQRQNERAERAPREGVSLSKAQGKALAMAVGAMIAVLALYVVVSAAVNWTQVKLDDFQYGRPRTTQMEAYVGHSEAEGSPSHFIAMNLNRRVTILQLPGGDSTKATAIVGPYLFGQGEDLTPVLLNVQDVNVDGKPDLVVSVKSEQLLYLNDGAAFKMATPEEQAAIFKALTARTAAPVNDAQGVAPEGQ